MHGLVYTSYTWRTARALNHIKLCAISLQCCMEWASSSQIKSGWTLRVRWAHSVFFIRVHYMQLSFFISNLFSTVRARVPRHLVVMTTCAPVVFSLSLLLTHNCHYVFTDEWFFYVTQTVCQCPCLLLTNRNLIAHYKIILWSAYVYFLNWNKSPNCTRNSPHICD